MREVVERDVKFVLTEAERVECHVEKDFRTGTVNTVNPETGEVIDSRAMSGHERQQNFIDVVPEAIEGPQEPAAPEDSDGIDEEPADELSPLEQGEREAFEEDRATEDNTPDDNEEQEHHGKKSKH